MNKTANAYVADIKSGKIPACIHVQRAVDRYERDLKEGHKRGLFFNPEPGNMFLAWAANTIVWTKGSQVGQPVIFEPWQQFHFHQIFGWRVGSMRGNRRFRISYLEIPRKNGKTPMAATVALYMAFFDGEARAQVYTAATKRDQAKICLNDAAAFVKQSPILNTHIGTLSNAIYFKNSPQVQFDENFIHPLSSDANTLDGLDVHCGVIDEFHAHPDARVYDVIKTATGARKQPLIYVITTAGDDKTSVCHDVSEYTEKVLRNEIQDDRFLGIRYTIDEGDDPFTDPTCWIKANPNLNVSKYPAYIEGEIQEAGNRPSYINTVKKYDFNLWVDVLDAWVPVERWRKLKSKIAWDDPETFANMSCMAGLDLAATEDFNALALLWFDETENRYYTRTWFWIPESKMDERKRKMPHDAKRWVRQNWVKVTPGNAMSDRIIADDVLNICQKFNVQALSYDRRNAHSGVVQDIAEEMGSEFCVPQSQDMGSMSTPTKELRKLINRAEIKHNGNPIMAWQLGNVVVYYDANDNEKLIKGKSKDKIDGIVALINAVAQHMEARANLPWDYYDSHDITSINLNG
jgi:phage terminase large subunit-like protein